MRRRSLLVAAFAVLVTRAAAQVDPSGTYRTLTTPHFRVHFRPPNRAIAETAAREAEQAFSLLDGELERPRGTIDLVLSDEWDVANGFANFFPTNRITVLLTPPIRDGVAEFDSWLRLVVTHELAHVFHLDRARGVWDVAQTVLGRAQGSFPNAYQPSWVTEGLATYYESRYTTAGRVDGSFHRQLLRGELLDGTQRRPNDATSVELRWPDGNAPYAYGGQFFDRLSVHQDAVPALVEATSGQWIPFRVGRQVSRVTGDTLGVEWKQGLASLDGGPALIAAGERVLARELLSHPIAARSPDAARLAYVHDDGWTPSRVVVLDLATGAPIASHLLNAEGELTWHGDTLLVTQLDRDGLYQIRGDLYAWVPVPGGDWRRVTRGERLASPHGRGAVVAAIRLSAGGREPVLVGTDGTLSPLPTPEPPAIWGEVAPSGDGRWWAGVRHAGGQWDVVAWPTGRPDSARSVTQDAAVDEAPAWASDGTLVFTSDRSGLPQIYRWNPADGQTTRLSDAPNGARDAELGADGMVVYGTIAGRGRVLVLARALEIPVATSDGSRPPFEPAPDIPLREGPFRQWRSLVPRYWLPYVATGEAGTFLGGLTSGVDVVGRTSYFGALAVAPENGRWVGTVGVTDARFGRPVFDGSASQDWSEVVDGTGIVYGLRERDAALGATWVWRRWRWAVSLRVAGEYEEDALDPEVAKRELAGGSVFIGYSRAVIPALALSRERGFQVLLGYRRRERVDTSGWSNEWRARGAVYVPTPWPQHVLAARAAAGVTGGPTRPVFEVGGLSGDALPVAPGVALGGRRTFPVRGYPAATLLGSRAASGTVEYRAPLLYVGRGVGNLPLGLSRLSAAVFGDAGGAWNEGESGAPAALASVGGELVTDGTVFYDLFLRLRLGLAVPLRDAGTVTAGRPALYLGVGSDF